MDTVSAGAGKYTMVDGQPYNERRRQARHSRTALVGGVVMRERDDGYCKCTRRYIHNGGREAIQRATAAGETLTFCARRRSGDARER